jgi:hypothetical protein
VREAAEAGAEETEIIRALEIPESALEDQVVLTRFRDSIAVGHARFLLELRQAIRRRGLRTPKGAGSVNALALQARNHLDWDKLLPAQETEPDLGTARQRLKDLLARLAESRSEIEGRNVSMLELLEREAKTVEPSRDREPAPRGSEDPKAEGLRLGRALQQKGLKR